MSDVGWDVGLSDVFFWFLFDLLLLSLFRVGGIYYVMNYTDLSLNALPSDEDRNALM